MATRPEQRLVNANVPTNLVRLDSVSRHPPWATATRLDIARGRVRMFFGWCLGWLAIPVAVRDTDIQDEVTGDHASVRVGPLLTVLSVNGRDYYFERITGRFDGSGSSRGWCRSDLMGVTMGSS